MVDADPARTGRDGTKRDGDSAMYHFFLLRTRQFVRRLMGGYPRLVALMDHDFRERIDVGAYILACRNTTHEWMWLEMFRCIFWCWVIQASLYIHEHS